MARAISHGAFVLGQAAVLLLVGIAAIWWSNDLMLWLIWLVGEEYALGPESIIHLENGAKLITNPSGMVRWMLPFWFLGMIQILAARTLSWLWWHRPP